MLDEITPKVDGVETSVAKLTDQAALANVAGSDKESDVREAASQRLRELKR